MKTTNFFRIIFSLLFIILSISNSSIFAQVTIGNNVPPKPFSLLEIDANNIKGGLRLPQLTEDDKTALRDSISKYPTAALGLLAFNKDNGNVEYWDGSDWITAMSVEPWLVSGSESKAFQNTDNIYQMGSVGIGTMETPDAKLEVVGNAIIREMPTGTTTDSVVVVVNGLLKKIAQNAIIPASFNFNSSVEINVVNGVGATLKDITASINPLSIGTAKITDGAITTAKIAAGNVTGNKIAQNGATSGQALKWDGATWAPATDIGITTVTANSPITVTSTATTATIGIINGTTAGQILKWNGSAWTLRPDTVVEPWQVSGGAIKASSNIENIYQTGKVGIGINAPVYQLDVSATANPLRLQGVQRGVSTDSLLTINNLGIVRQRSVYALRQDIIKPEVSPTQVFPGMIKFDTTTNTMQYYDGSKWQIISSNAVSTKNEGVVKINTGGGVAPSVIISNKDIGKPLTEKYVNYSPGIATTSTFWPENQAQVESNIIGSYNSRTTFIENSIVGQVHYWRITGSYDRGSSGQIAWMFFRLFNPKTTFSLKQYVPCAAQSFTGDFAFNFITIADKLSLPPTASIPDATGVGYHLVISADQEMTVTINSITRISMYKD